MNEFKRDGFGRVVMQNTDKGGGKISSQTVEANLLLSILEKLTEISETNKSILGEVNDIQGPPTG